MVKIFQAILAALYGFSVVTFLVICGLSAYWILMLVSAAFEQVLPNF